MNIVLQKDVKKLGYSGDILEVAIGYAQNFLIPKGLAKEATASEIAKAEIKRAERIARHEEIVKNADSFAKKLEKTILKFTRKVNSGEKVFAGVSEGDITVALLDQAKIELDKSHIHFLKGHPKTLGKHIVDIHLYEGKHINVTIDIVAE